MASRECGDADFAIADSWITGSREITYENDNYF